MHPTDDATADPSTPSMLNLVARGLARGVLNAVVCSLVIALESWVAFAFVAVRLWSTPPASSIGKLVVSARLPLALVYVVVFPIVGLLLGKKVAIQTALGRIAQQRSRQLATWLSERALPVCQQLAQLPGTQTLQAVTEALLNRVSPAQNEGLRRWLLRHLLHAIKLPELCAATGFLEEVRLTPERARERMIESVDAKVRALGASPLAGLGAMCLFIFGLTLAVYVATK